MRKKKNIHSHVLVRSKKYHVTFDDLMGMHDKHHTFEEEQ